MMQQAPDKTACRTTPAPADTPTTRLMPCFPDSAPTSSAFLTATRPPARTWEVLTCYPGLHALVLHRRGALVLDAWLQMAGALYLAHRALADRHRNPPRRQDWRARVLRPRAWAWWWAKPPKSATAARFTRASRWAAPRSTRAPSATRRWAGTWWWAPARKVLGGFTVGDGAKIGSQRGGDQAGARRRHGGGQPGAHHPGRAPTSSARRPPARWGFQPTASRKTTTR